MDPNCASFFRDHPMESFARKVEVWDYKTKNNQLNCKSYFSQEVEIRDHGKEASCYPVEGTGMFGWCNVRFPFFIQMYRKISSYSFIDLQFHQIFTCNIYVFTNYSIATWSPIQKLIRWLERGDGDTAATIVPFLEGQSILQDLWRPWSGIDCNTVL